MAKVVYEPQAMRAYEGLPPRIKARVFDIAQRLANWPTVSGAKPLRGKLAGHFRMRTGDYRVQFRVVADTVTIEKLGHRDGFYED